MWHVGIRGVKHGFYTTSLHNLISYTLNIYYVWLKKFTFGLFEVVFILAPNVSKVSFWPVKVWF